jgi:hypothetical protein
LRKGRQKKGRKQASKALTFFLFYICVWQKASEHKIAFLPFRLTASSPPSPHDSTLLYQKQDEGENEKEKGQEVYKMKREKKEVDQEVVKRSIR